MSWNRWPGLLLVVAVASSACEKDSSDDGGRASKDQPQTQAPFAGQSPGGGSTAPPLLGVDNPENPVPGTKLPPMMPVDCGRVDINVSRVLPSVMLLVDGSQSMVTNTYGTAEIPDGGIPDGGMAPMPPTRWAAVRKALVDPVDGVVPKLEKLVRFGLAVFGTAPTCPLPLGTIAPATENFTAIQAALPVMPPGMYTPTGPALDMIVEMMPDPTQMLDKSVGPQIIVLATDGDPNDCGNMGGGGLFGGGIPMTNYQPSIQAALKGQNKHLKMYVISVGQDAGIQHLQEMANLGAGMPQTANPGADVYYPENPAALASTLETLIGAEIPCEVELEGRGVRPGFECKGEVTLNGVALPCNDLEQGWTLVDSNHIKLEGMACEQFKNAYDALLHATFPCDAILL